MPILITRYGDNLKVFRCDTKNRFVTSLSLSLGAIVELLIICCLVKIYVIFLIPMYTTTHLMILNIQFNKNQIYRNFKFIKNKEILNWVKI